MATKPQPKRRKVQKRTKEGKPLQHVQWQALAVENLTPLFQRQLVVGTNIMVARVQLKKGCLVPEHHHLHEQVSCVMQGAIKFWIDGREIVVRAGEVLPFLRTCRTVSRRSRTRSPSTCSVRRARTGSMEPTITCAASECHSSRTGH
jgi:quercetin dioxygenase-like cupin family protein